MSQKLANPTIFFSDSVVSFFGEWYLSISQMSQSKIQDIDPTISY